MSRSPDHRAPDSDLFRRAGAGDAEALARVVAIYQARLLARIRVMMGPDARSAFESGDVLQNVFSDAIRGIRAGDLRDENAFLRWVTTIARNYIVDEVRRRREQSLEALSGELVLVADEASVHARLSAEEGVQRLVEALAELDPVRQRVVELRALEGWSWARVAAELGRSEEAVRKLYNRALIELGERLAHETSHG
jgi:RNA polymerase sigma-70 factor (ECF subfamily)